MDSSVQQMQSVAIWYVTYTLRERDISQRYRRCAENFESEEDAKAFARLRLGDARNIVAGTINPHMPKRTIASVNLVNWLNE